MAANRTSLAMTTGRLGAPMGGLRSAIAAPAGMPAWLASSGTALAALPSAILGALALSLKLPIGCRA